MTNLRKTIEILFKKKNPEKIIKDYYSQDAYNNVGNLKMTEDEFLGYFNYSKTEGGIYNGNEIKNTYNLYMKEKGQKTIFSTLLNFSKEILIEEQDEPICRYEKLLKWRELSFQLGEDLLTTSYLADKDLNNNQKRDFFAWAPVIGNNNSRLKQILKKGIAENHFHLKGSGTHFNISWISLMNNLQNRDKEFEKLFKSKKLRPRLEIDFIETSYDLRLLLKKAAVIRFFLNRIITEELEINELFELKEHVKKALISKSLLEFKMNEFCIKISAEKQLKGKRIGNEILDYCILDSLPEENFVNKSAIVLLCGERRFLYDIFKKIYSEDQKIMEYEPLFYAYILVKQQFRDEIIQVNREIGFENFGNYQSRKSYFIQENSLYEKAIVNSAVNATILNQSIKSLEARIAPKNKESKLRKEIEKLDLIVEDDIFSFNGRDLEKRISLCECGEQKHFYTIHFIKESDINYNEKNLREEKLIIQCRNKKVRESVLKQVLAIEKLIKSNSKYKNRIFGIDAANIEVGCRPEVFALGYRYLKCTENVRNQLYSKKKLNTLGRSFHVGEEFLDIIDGLRAIDECIKFLNFDQGDRLGHALALGIEPQSYYKSKDFTLIMPKQDLLDNIAWILGKVNEKGIDISSAIIYKLENYYREYYHDIYESEGKEWECHRTYYESWKLRGDDPDVYLNEKKNKEEIEDFKKIFKIDGIKLNEGKEITIARKNKKARELYRQYHFNKDVKINGAKIVEFKIDYGYIDIVKKLQYSMQKEIAEKNICIETNPSSNYLIGTINRYDEHPLTKFYNLGLTTDGNKLKECPQISVSINTDDQGVFGTYLENEYGLMALSLEKSLDIEGEKIYSPSMIYDWLNRIREMGLEQSFYTVKDE